MVFTSKGQVLSYMLRLTSRSKLSLVNLFNFYIEHNKFGYTLHLSKPTVRNEESLVNGLKFYLQNTRK